MKRVCDVGRKSRAQTKPRIWRRGASIVSRFAKILHGSSIVGLDFSCHIPMQQTQVPKQHEASFA